MPPSRILVIDDEPAIRESLVFALERDGFAASECATLARARDLWSDSDLLILDLMLPDGSGTEFLRELRNESNVPVIVLTSRDSEADKVVGLELGADDYVVKPFSPREVIARVRAVLRRTAGTNNDAESDTVEASGIRLDVGKRRVWVAAAEEQEITLSRLEFDLLETLVRAPGRVFDRQRLLDRVWGNDTIVTDRTVDAHIKSLRKKLVAAGLDADTIETVRGVGYRLRESE